MQSKRNIKNYEIYRSYFFGEKVTEKVDIYTDGSYFKTTNKGVVVTKGDK